MIDALARDHPGRSASQRHRRVARAWRRRTFGRWAPLTLWGALAVVLLVLLYLHLASRWALMAGLFVGMFLMGLRMLPDALMPGYIFNWQLGAWGEQNTASELARLSRKTWTVRHDLRWGARAANHDHIVAGPTVFVLNSKNAKDSHLTIEGNAVRLARLDDPDDGYLADWWIPSATREAHSLEWELEQKLGFPVAVYPVVVIWGDFQPEPCWIDKAWVVRGDKVVDLLSSRPVDLLNARKRELVRECVRARPRAG